MTFYLGFSISAYQTEGNNFNSDWYYYELHNKLPKSGECCRLWERYEELVPFLTGLNVNAFRFSIEWSRIYPTKDSIDYSSLRRYVKFIKALKENNIEPFITLWHFTNPKWFSDLGGWLDKGNISYFLDFVETIVRNTKDYVKYYITVNEPLLYSIMSYLLGKWPPFKSVRSLESIGEFIDVYKNIKKASDEAYDIIKEQNENSHVIYVENLSNTLNIIPFIGKNIVKLLTNSYPEKIDEIGINYYGSVKNLKELEDRNYNLDIDFLDKILDRLNKKYRKPIFITETGISTEDEFKRMGYLKKIIYFVIEKGEKYNIQGLFFWSICDNYEWEIGYKAHFGILTKELEKKDSYYELKDLISNLYSKIFI